MGGIEAQSGFYFQNVLGALRALDLIELGNPLFSVSFDNPAKAQYIDDIVAEGTGFVEFTQVKWAEDEDASFTLANLTAVDDSSGKSLLQKIAEGFRQIQGLEGTKTVVLYSTRSAGTNAQPAKGFTKSLQAFLEDFHAPFREDLLNSDIENAANYREFQGILDILEAHTGFSDRAGFAGFLKCLRFDLGRPDKETLVEHLKMRLERLGITHKSYGLLTNKIVEWSIDRINVKAEDVLRELGLEDRFVDSLKQNFPVDVDRLVPLPYLADGIAKALDVFSSGYILLLGEPGVGKSTALTTLTAYRRDITFEYFCFIPNERSLGNDRLDSSAFVRSLCIGLRNAFPDEQLPSTYSELTKATLNSWLNFLSGQGKRVIFVVDGLDHVDNKYHQGVLDHPLTDALDGILPRGVFMILSSQYIEALPPQVQDEIKRDADRLIPVRRFDQAETQDFFRRRHIHLSDQNLLRTHEISGGVPIYLEYLANALSDFGDYDQTQYLQGAPSLQDRKIDAYHDHLWHAVEQDEVAVATLSLLAIRQDFTTVGDLKALFDILEIHPSRAAVEASLKKIAHVLRVSDAHGYAIRHESFRLYVEGKTSTNIARLNEALHRWYADHPETNEAWRHRFRHLYELGFYRELLAASNDEWLRKGWAQYRPFAEVNDNIDIAWRAAAELRDLTEFVRIGLMRQRVSLVKDNLGREEPEIAVTLLRLGHPKEALLRVWDGERAIAGQVSFASFCLNHRALLGRPPSLGVMRQGLGEKLPSGVVSDDYATYCRACTYTADPIALLTRVAQLSWTHKDKGESEEIKYDASRNLLVNWTIAAAIIDELYTDRKTRVLLDIVDCEDMSADVRRYAALAAATLLHASNEGQEAAKLLAEHALSGLPRHEANMYLLALAEQGMDISGLVVGSSKPKLPNHLISQRGFALADGVISVYDDLRVVMLVDQSAKQWFTNEIASFPPDVKQFLLTLGRLAELWVARVTRKQQPAAAGQFTDLAKSFLRVRQELLDADAPTSPFDHELPDFLDYVWTEAEKTLDDTQLSALATAWLQQRLAGSRKPAPELTRGLIYALVPRLTPSNQQVIALLRAAEEDARLEEETATLSAELLATASLWARAGFPTEAERLWNELLDAACGVYYRKDYQFNEILVPMRLAHGPDPQGTLSRIEEQLVLAHQLEEAARSKTTAIAIEELISFAAEESPSLSLDMLYREERMIFRERAIKSLVRVLLEDKTISPRLVWSLASTMSIWEDYRHFNDETAPAMRSIYEECLQRGSTAEALEIYQQARQLFLVQKNMPKLLGSWAHLWVEAGDAPDEVQSDCDEYWIVPPAPSSGTTLDFDIEPEDVNKLDEAIKLGISELDKELDRVEEWSLTRSRAMDVDKLRHQWKRRVVSALERELTEPESAAFETGFERLEASLLAVKETNHVKIEQIVRQALSDFLSDFEKGTNASSPLQTSLDTYNLESWLQQFLHKGSSRFTTERILKKRLLGWIANYELRKLSEILDFCRRRCWNDFKGEALAAIAKRVKPIDKDQAFELLLEARQSTADLFFAHKRLAKSVLNEAMEIDPDRGVQLLFSSFREHHQRYPQSIVHELDEVVRFHAHFPRTDLKALYDVWSGYNRTLAAGLALKPVNTTYLHSALPASFMDAALLYLIRMLDYPDVDIRFLASNACFTLLERGVTTPQALLKQWDGMNATQKEMLVSVLSSFSLKHPESRSAWISPLLDLAKMEVHLNLRRSIAHLVLGGIATGLPPGALQAAKNLQDPRSNVRPNGGLA
jgi:hypothetical protein